MELAMTLATLANIAQTISAKGGVSPEKATEVLEIFIKALFRNLDVGDEFEVFAPPKPDLVNPDNGRYVIRKLAEDKLFFGRM